MALFPKSDPAKKRQRDLEEKLKASLANRDKIADRVRAFEARATERRHAARALARDGGDDAKLAIIESEMRAAEHRVATLTGGLSDIDKDISELEREIAQIIDQRCRSETAAAVSALADKWATAGAAFDAAVGELVELARESAAITLDAHPLKVFLTAVKEQVPPEAALIASVLRHHATAVLAGSAPASLPVPEAEPAPLKAVEPAVETRRLFALRSVKWKDAEGRQRYGSQYEDADLPPGAAQRGLRIGAVAPLDDPRRKQLRGSRGGHHVDPNAIDLLDLDSEEATRPPHIAPVMATDPLASADFRVIDRSAEARTLKIDVPRL